MTHVLKHSLEIWDSFSFLIEILTLNDKSLTLSKYVSITSVTFGALGNTLAQKLQNLLHDCALVTSHLDYCNSLVYNLPDRDIERFQRYKIITALCSEGSMFRRFYVQKVLSSEGPLFKRSYVQKVLCSEGSIFRRFYVQKVLCSEIFVQKVLCLESTGDYLSGPIGHTDLDTDLESTSMSKKRCVLSGWVFELK